MTNSPAHWLVRTTCQSETLSSIQENLSTDRTSAVYTCVYVTDRYTMRHEDIGVHDGDQLVQEVGLILKQLWRQLLHHLLKTLSCYRWNPVPSLWFTPGNNRQEQVKNTEGALQFFIFDVISL